MDLAVQTNVDIKCRLVESPRRRRSKVEMLGPCFFSALHIVARPGSSASIIVYVGVERTGIGNQTTGTGYRARDKEGQTPGWRAQKSSMRGKCIGRRRGKKKAGRRRKDETRIRPKRMRERLGAGLGESAGYMWSKGLKSMRYVE